MNWSADFQRRYHEIHQARKWSSVTAPHNLIAGWRNFVELCLSGYDMGIEEYDNDLFARDDIEIFLEDPQLGETSDMRRFSTEIFEIDSRFRALLQPDSIPIRPGSGWWRAHPPKYAGEQLARDFMETYGVRVEIRKSDEP